MLLSCLTAQGALKFLHLPRGQAGAPWRDIVAEHQLDAVGHGIAPPRDAGGGVELRRGRGADLGEAFAAHLPALDVAQAFEVRRGVGRAAAGLGRAVEQAAGNVVAHGAGGQPGRRGERAERVGRCRWLHSMFLHGSATVYHKN